MKIVATSPMLDDIIYLIKAYSRLIENVMFDIYKIYKLLEQVDWYLEEMSMNKLYVI